MKKIIEKLAFTFINGNIVTLWVWSILFLYLAMNNTYGVILWIIFWMLYAFYFNSMIARTIYLTLSDAFKDAISTAILNKFIDNKITEITIKTKG